MKLRCTCFYGVADQALRSQSWDLLRTLAATNDLPWVVGGDFNEILTNSENEGGPMQANSLMEAFRTALVEYALSEVNFVGD